MIFTLALVGCNASQSGSSGSFGNLGFGSSKKAPEINVYVGTSALAAEFAKTAPPPKVFEQSSFPILIRVRNLGAYNVENGFLSIGRERDYIPQLYLDTDNMVIATPWDNVASFKLEGKSQQNPQGDELLVSFNAKTGKLDSQSENKQSTLTATMCYPYKTVLSTTVCIDPDVAGIRPGKKACTVKDLSFNNGQGAPISIVKIEPQMIPEVGPNVQSASSGYIKPQFLIFVENKGRGIPVDVYNQNYIEACSKKDANVDYPYWNTADIRAYTSGDISDPQKRTENQLVCCPNVEGQCLDQPLTDSAGFLRFKDKKDYVRCTFKNGISRNSDAYASPLRIEVDYGYVQTISTNFFIQKPLKY